ncbi:uncharacterized protein BO97DRAFT_430186 [Aspergillus homomorphus CBS 101889]|uniref:Uncharacterized protein n=1 Tax=Aspergillus homomorphus (strain CBS 101889) TaxID=1450537 RepID=A0A395HHL5_ASPHC|nr:hypothetical protein BO97DRAFT_430186 [Aspergillus homomorphus CBS 101889]RAL06468.1 hypothetical protein BO97DRAFT_430186 [Aspergillus homomorphus CBS 101889]
MADLIPFRTPGWRAAARLFLTGHLQGPLSLGCLTSFTSLLESLNCLTNVKPGPELVVFELKQSSLA